MTQIFRITGSSDGEFRPNEPIKLLEVNENTVPAGIMPIQFGPSPASGLNYPTIIVEVTPTNSRRSRISSWSFRMGGRSATRSPGPLRRMANERAHRLGTRLCSPSQSGFQCMGTLRADPEAVAEECHQFLFLQMACEKLCKAYLFQGGSPARGSPDQSRLHRQTAPRDHE